MPAEPTWGMSAKEMKVSRDTACGHTRALVRLIARLAILTFILLLDTVISSSTGQAASPGRNGKIAFSVGQQFPFDPKTFEVYVMDANGNNRTRLTNNSAFDSDPNWSPDGKRIAFTSNRDGNFDVWVMTANGRNPRNLTNTRLFDEFTPDWSPDSEQIAFTRAPVGEFENDKFDNLEIFLMEIGSDHDPRLRRLTNDNEDDSSPAWSPDGTMIAFTSNRDGNYEIYVMKPNGNKLTNLTNNPADDGFAWPAQTWSPDGKRIAFTSNRGGNEFFDFRIYVMDASGSDQTNLTNTPARDIGPTWSPDGKKIAFSRRQEEIFDLWVMDTDGSNQTPLTNSGVGEDELHADWAVARRH